MDDLFESTTPLPAPPEPKAEAHPEGEMPFFPDFALREALVALVFLCVLLLVASITKPGLEPGADPAAAVYVPKPEWYFLWLFQTLKYFKGEMEVIGTFVLPTIKRSACWWPCRSSTGASVACASWPPTPVPSACGRGSSGPY